MSDNKQNRLELDKNAEVQKPEAEKLSDEMLEEVTGGLHVINDSKKAGVQNDIIIA